MKRTIKNESEEARKERNFGEWIIAVAVVYILVASTWWLAGFVNQTRFCTDPLIGQTMLQQ